MKKLLIVTVLGSMLSMSSGCMSSGCRSWNSWFHRGDACDTQYGMGGGCNSCNSGSMVSGMPTSAYGPTVVAPGTTYVQPLPGPTSSMREVLPNG